MNQLMEDKRIRYLVVAVLAVVLILGLLNIISTAFSLIVPLAIVTAGAFAFYKIVLQGRDSPDVMEDEVAESAGVDFDEAVVADASEDSADVDDDDDLAARQRLSALKRAESDFFDTVTPTEEILDQIRSRKQRLTGDDVE
ncbi:MAG: hypothetical protein F4X87_10840 [Chloroflexi bacterium]|nr:hypothetical protein [Chloroflexota bacterium]